MMNKIVFMLFLCIFYSTNLFAMENNSLKGACISLESRVIQNLREHKNNFDQTLDWATDALRTGRKDRQEKYTDSYYNYLDDCYKSKEDHEIYYVNLILKPFLNTMMLGPGMFFKYCYYLKHHNKESMWHINIEQLVACADLLRKCQEHRIDDCSALGAAIIAPDVCVKDKRGFIRKLMMHGFELTQKDRELAALELYDGIPTEQKEMMIFLLCAYNEGNLSILPYDVIQYIIQYIISLYEIL